MDKNVSKLEKKRTLKELTLNFWGRVVCISDLAKVSCPALPYPASFRGWNISENMRTMPEYLMVERNVLDIELFCLKNMISIFGLPYEIPISGALMN